MMKKLFAILSFLLISSFGSIAQDGYDISVKLKGGPTETDLYLAHFFGYNQYIKVDSAKLENGSYHFSGEKPLKGGVYLLVVSQSKYYDFVVSGDESKFSIDADTTNFVKTVKFEGSKENDILFSYRKFLMEKSDEAAALNQQMQVQQDPASKEITRQKLMGMQAEVSQFMKKVVADNEGTFAAKVIEANFEPEIPKEIPLNADGTKDSTFAYRYYKSHFWDHIDFSDERLLKTPFMQTKLEKYFKDLVYQVQDSIIKDADYVINLSKKNTDVHRYVLWNITNKYENIDIVGLDGVFVHLAENHYLKDATWIDSTQRAKFEQRVRILKPLQTGKVFPELIVADTTGKEMNVKSGNGKYTIVYFYGPDCGHCKESAPKLMEYYEANKDKGVDIYNIAVDYEIDKIKNFIKTYNVGPLKNVWDSKGRYYFREKFDIYSTPTSYILNEKKEIIGKRIPIEEFGRFIDFYESKQAASKSGK